MLLLVFFLRSAVVCYNFGVVMCLQVLSCVVWSYLLLRTWGIVCFVLICLDVLFFLGGLYSFLTRGKYLFLTIFVVMPCNALHLRSNQWLRF